MEVSEVKTYAAYELVEDSYDPETKWIRIYSLKTTVRLRQRMIHSKTWEATLQEDQEFPGPVNPGGLLASDGWVLHSCRCLKSLSAPFSRRAVETWTNTGSWETIEEWEE